MFLISFFAFEGFEKREGKKTNSSTSLFFLFFFLFFFFFFFFFFFKNTPFQAPAAPRPRARESAAPKPSRSRTSPRHLPSRWAWSASGRTRGLEKRRGRRERRRVLISSSALLFIFIFFVLSVLPVPSCFDLPGFELRLCKLKRTIFFSYSSRRRTRVEKERNEGEKESCFLFGLHREGNKRVNRESGDSRVTRKKITLLFDPQQSVFLFFFLLNE